MADSWDSWFGQGTYDMPDSSWQYTMPQQNDLMQWNPGQTSGALTDLFGLGSIGAQMPQIPNTSLVSNAGADPRLAALLGNQPGGAQVGGGAGGGAPTPQGKPTANWGLDMLKKNPGALLALLGAGGAGIAGAVQGSQRAKLPGQVQDLAARATAPVGTDPYADAQLDRTMRRDIGPGWETSTPGIQARQMQTNARIQGDRAAAAGGLGTIGSLYGQQDALKQQNTQGMFQLAALLGTMGLGGLGRQNSIWGY